jgi:predicted transcriptional regulator
VQEILAQHLDYERWFVKEVKKGIESADRGELVPQKEVFRKIREKSAARRKALRKKAA